MKEIKLMNLSLKNFKGIKEFSLEVNGEDVKVFGDNATGKTTLYDAFLWLLFNKDSQNKAKFSIKTLTADGQEMNNLEHEVEASFLVEGQPLTLKKIHYENWTQKRNALEKTFDGNKNKYEIDGVPTPEGQYKKFIEALIDEEVFKLLTSPTYFNDDKIHKWQERRKFLLDITGDLTDEEVISANEKLRELTGVLNGRKIEDHKKVIAAKKKKINEKIKSIPTRISEINNMLPEESVEVASIEVEVAKIEKELDKHATQINNIKNGSAINEKHNQLRQIELDLKEIQNELEAESVEKGYQVQAKIQEEQSNVSNLERKKEDSTHRIGVLEKDVISFDEKRATLLESWTKENERTYTHEHESNGVCPTCSQSLPVEELEAAKEKSIAAFNLSKATALERININGKAIAEDKTQTLEQIEKSKEIVASLSSQIMDKEKVISRLTTELNTLREAVKDARQNPKYQAKLQEQLKINDEINSLKENAQQAVTDVETEVVKLRAKRTELNTQIAQQAQAIASKNRIAELEAQQEQLAKDFENVEKELFLIEEFTRIKVEMLDEKINSKFKIARFKLTHKQVNGALEETCETTFNGVPYGSGLNNAGKINVGLDIIQTLSEHYGFRVPIFVDNAEAVSQLIDLDTQVISLIVSEQDKQLRIEKQNDNIQEAI